MDRCAIFIDGAYLDKLLQHRHGGVRIDFRKFPQHISAGCELLRTYYYHCLPYQSGSPTPEERQRFSGKSGT